MLPFHSFFSGSSGSSLAHLLSVSWSPGGSIRALNSTLTWISMPSRRATLSSISWSWRIPAAQRRRKTQLKWDERYITWTNIFQKHAENTKNNKQQRKVRRLPLVLTDMIDSTSTELPMELLGPEAPEVLDGEGPEVQHIVPGEGISLLQQHHFGAQESQLDGCTEAAWPRTNDYTLETHRETQMLWLSFVLSLKWNIRNICL